MNFRNKAIILLLALSTAGFAVFSQIDPADELLHLAVFSVPTICFSTAIALIFGVSWKRREVVIDGEAHRICVPSPRKRLEYFRPIEFGKRLHVYVNGTGLKTVEEREVHLMYCSFWEQAGVPRVANALETRIYDKLFG